MVYADLASILTIKAMLNHGLIIDKFLQQEYLTSAIGMLECTSLGIKEQTIKLIICLYQVNLKQKKVCPHCTHSFLERCLHAEEQALPGRFQAHL